MAQRMSRLKKTIIVASVAALSLGGAGVAFAYWTSTGTGVGGASTGEPVLFTIASLASEDPPLTPGGPGQVVPFTVTNPGPGNLYFGSATVAIAGVNNAPWVPPALCDPAFYTAVITTMPGGQDLAAGEFVTGQVTVTMLDSGTNQDTCQGEAVPLWFTASSATLPPPL